METFRFYRFTTQHGDTAFWCNKNPKDDEYIRKSYLIKLLKSEITDREENIKTLINDNEFITCGSENINTEIACIKNLLEEVE